MYAVTLFVLLCILVGGVATVYFTKSVTAVRVGGTGEETPLNQDRSTAKAIKIAKDISEGADAFLFAEYRMMAVFIVAFSAIVLCFIGVMHSWSSGFFTMLAFVAGSTTSILSGYIGMKAATASNIRTVFRVRESFDAGFKQAFKGAAIMGFALVSLGLLVLFAMMYLFTLYFTNAFVDSAEGAETTRTMFECIAGYGLGGSSIALFGRVGGGIYTKAADVGADLSGKVENNLREDDPRNPAVIADNVGDNVGDVAGMASDLFGSLCEATCAALVLTSQSEDLFHDWRTIAFPVAVTAAGVVVSLITCFFATHLDTVEEAKDIEPALKKQLYISTILSTPALYILSQWLLPAEFGVRSGGSVKGGVRNTDVFICLMCGLWGGLLVGVITEYFTSYAYSPVQEVSHASQTGAATNIIYGLALGYKSVILPVFVLAITIYVSYSLAGMYGIAFAGLGILNTMATGLTIDAFGPIADNAGGIAEMSEMGENIRDRTDALDAAGNTTAAIGKGFAIGSAALVSLALFGAFVTSVGLEVVDLLSPAVYAGVLVGSMLPFWFSAMTMKSVGEAAHKMVVEVRRQFSNKVRLRDADAKWSADGAEAGRGDELISCILLPENHPQYQAPDYKACVTISTEASLSEMVAPGALVMITPLVVGFLFGVDALAGVLAGSLVCGVQMAISQSNSGGAWDNAKKYISAGLMKDDDGNKVQKGSETHDASIIGDTVGDPLKDTSGPALNILIKLSAIISLVFAPSFPSGPGLLLKVL